MAIIDRIVIWNRTDVPADRNQPRDLYTSRLFPCWAMVGRDPFPKEANTIGLKEGLRWGLMCCEMIMSDVCIVHYCV